MEQFKSLKALEKPNLWYKKVETKSGRTFYYNPKLGKTSWTDPTKLNLKLDSKDNKWTEKVDKETGRRYYYNKALGLTSWKRPRRQEQRRLINSLKKPEQRVKSVEIAAVEIDTASELKRLSSHLKLGLEGSKRSSQNSANISVLYQNDGFDAIRKLKRSRHMSLGLRSAVESTIGDDYLLINLVMDLNSVDIGMIEVREFLEFAEQKYNTQSSLFCMKRNSVLAEMTIHRAQSMKNPLLSLDKQEKSKALECFKQILFYLQKSNSIKLAKAIQKIVGIGLEGTVQIKDEIYCQLIKQSSGIMDVEMLEKVVEIFTIVCGCFKPSRSVEPYFKSHLRKLYELDLDENGRLQQMIKYSLLRYEKHLVRERVPSFQEIAAVKSLAPVEFMIHLVSAPSITVNLDCWTTVKTIKDKIMKRYQILDKKAFALFEIENGEFERELTDETLLLDLLQLWDENSREMFECFFKLRLYYDFLDDDTAAIELAYLQLVFEVSESRFPCEREDVITLAAIEAQEKFGNFIEGSDVFGDEIEVYLPLGFCDGDQVKYEQFKVDIYNTYRALKDTSKFKCMVAYLDYVKQLDFYGCACFKVKPLILKTMDQNFPPYAIIGVNFRGVVIFSDDKERTVVAKYKYSEIVTWGKSDNAFVLVVGNLIVSTKLFFSTWDGAAINSLIKDYTDKLNEADRDTEGFIF